jgi:hypothetical protein
MKCETCKFYDPFERAREAGEEAVEGLPDAGHGRCHRYPPTLRRPLLDTEDSDDTSDSGVVRWLQPGVAGDDWCGEWVVLPNVRAKLPAEAALPCGAKEN